MKSKKLKILEFSLFSFLALITAISASILVYENSYSGKILRNVSIENIDLTGKTIEQSKFLVEKYYNEKLNQAVILNCDNQEIKTSLKDTGVTFNIDQSIDSAYKVGRNPNMAVQLYETGKTVFTKKEIDPVPTIDQIKHQSFLDVAISQFNTKPEDANLYIENGEIKEKSETTGKTVITSELKDQIIELASKKDSVNNAVISLKFTAETSTINSEDFYEAKSYASNILNKNISFYYENKNFVPSKSEIGNWITFTNNNGKIIASLNDDNIKTYLNKIGKNFEVIKKNKKIDNNTNEVLDPGQEGKYLNKDDALNKLKSGLISDNTIRIELTVYTEAPTEIRVISQEGLVTGRFEGKYMDINLTTQKLCMIESTAIISCYSISSGKPSMPTPTGTFSIKSKSPRQYSAKYGMWMPWWQQFSGDYGIHELPETATWKEVPDHLGTPVSHGCVRLGVGPAETAYNWTEIGTIIYIHK